MIWTYASDLVMVLKRRSKEHLWRQREDHADDLSPRWSFFWTSEVNWPVLNTNYRIFERRDPYFLYSRNGGDPPQFLIFISRKPKSCFRRFCKYIALTIKHLIHIKYNNPKRCKESRPPVTWRQCNIERPASPPIFFRKGLRPLFFWKKSPPPCRWSRPGYPINFDPSLSIHALMCWRERP